MTDFDENAEPDTAIKRSSRVPLARRWGPAHPADDPSCVPA